MNPEEVIRKNKSLIFRKTRGILKKFLGLSRGSLNLVIWSLQLAWYIVLIPFLKRDTAKRKAEKKTRILIDELQDAKSIPEYIEKRNKLMKKL